MAKEKAPEACAPEALTNPDYSTLKAKTEFNDAFSEAMSCIPSVWDTALTFDPAERKRAWWFLLYPESMNPNALQICSESGYQGAFSPLHDRDMWPDGTKKKEHYHVLVYAPGKVTARSLMPLVRAVNGVRLQPVGSVIGACRYLPHMDIDPEHVPSDVGKVHYSPDDIVTFGGFDVQSFLKATQTQVATALQELYGFVEQTGITSYYGFICWVYEQKPEYAFMLANPQVTAQIDRFIRSKFAVLHRNDELKVARSQADEYRSRLDSALEATSRLEAVTRELIDTFREALNNGEH